MGFLPGKYNESSKKQGSWWCTQMIVMDHAIKLPEKGKEGTKAVRDREKL